ncbi:MAG: FAD-dependent thymidylate synthase [bacterium]|nr:FAD-dependent thymidylate synthase [bacterium]
MKPKRKIYAVGGLALPPEANAYGLARYSRSSKPVSETFTEMAEKILQGGESMKKFFEVFYFKYGHASIADLAHVSMALDNISMVAAIDVVDEQLWDGQERSTRYQKYTPDGVHEPATLKGKPDQKKSYQAGIKYLMDNYQRTYKELLPVIREANPLPKKYSEGAYKSATRARAFDIARYMLPLGSYTSVGQITSGRTLEKMISRLYSSEYSEVRDVADDLKTACSTPMFNPFSREINSALNSLSGQVKSNSDALKKIRRLKKVLTTVHPLPTLVKYTAPIDYLINTKKDLKQVAKEYLKIKTVDSNHDVQVFVNQDPLVEAVTTLLYWVTDYSYDQIRKQVNSWSRKKQNEVYEVGVRKRGKHDELLKVLDTQSITFDLLMDVGSYRDLHRHRRTVQIAQDYTYDHGYDWHDELEKYGNLYEYQVVMDAHSDMGKKLGKKNHEVGVYMMAMGLKRRALFKMGWNQVDYMGKLRTGVGRHVSYWKMALRMVEEAQKVCPERVQHIPTTPLSEDTIYER